MRSTVSALLGTCLLLLAQGCAKGGGPDSGPGGPTDAGPATDAGPGGTQDGGPNCGNAVVDPGEACDDGNADDTDACLPNCQMARCGDGVVWAGMEDCDDGNGVDGDACPNDCMLASCGNGTVDPGEECDDGNMDDTDACLGTCVSASCGDGVVWAGMEDCDDGNMDDTDACVGACVMAACGDGFLQMGVEACDDGNMIDDDGCTNACEGWQYRVPITFDAASAGTDVPILVVLEASTFGYANAASDGSDLRFGSDDDPANGFEAPHWIESWNAGGTSYVWVLVPSVSSGSNTIYGFYGFSGASVASTSDFATTFPNTYQTTGDATLGGSVTHDAFIVDPGHTVTVTAGSPFVVNAAYVRIEGTIDASAAGHPSGSGPGTGGTSTTAGAGGAGHGGTGGRGGLDSGDSPGSGGSTYGDTTSESIDMGSGGGTTDSSPTAGAGGGAVQIDARRILLPGTILADGAGGQTSGRCSGGGSGGGVMLRAYSLDFTGTISVDGGDGGDGTSTANDGGGGGGGGRVKLFHGGDLVDMGSTSRAGGAGGMYGSAGSGQAGSQGTTHTGTSSTLSPLPTIGAEQML